MEIYFIRHTTPLIAKGICYGQSDVPCDPEKFENEFTSIAAKLPSDIDSIFTSPLQRCKELACSIQQAKYPHLPVISDTRLKEINFGKWELQHWDMISNQDLSQWMDDFVSRQIPGGESYRDLYNRSVTFYATVVRENRNAIIVTHSGVIRSILCHALGTKLEDSFNYYQLPYGHISGLKITEEQAVRIR